MPIINDFVSKGVRRYSRSQLIKLRAQERKKRNPTKGPKPTRSLAKHLAREMAVLGETKQRKTSKGKTVEVPKQRAPKWYPTNFSKKQLRRKVHFNAPKIRSNITPGTVLILLAGRYEGHKVVFLKPLKSGLLLVTGPSKVNKIPLRRVNQAYVISTSTKIDISSVIIPDHIDDSYFKKPKKDKKSKGEVEFFGDASKKKKKLDQRVIDDNKSIGKQLIPIIKNTMCLRSYLCSRFHLTNKTAPHAMKF